MNIFSIVALLILGISPALAHVGHDVAGSFAAGLAHPFGGLDHVAAMIAVGVWAGLKGGQALWIWPAAFVVLMLIGGAFGMVMTLPDEVSNLVEPGILTSVVVLGLMVMLAVDLPVAAGAAMIGVFAIFHGYAHGSDIAENISGIEYIAGFTVATAALHMTGVGFAQLMRRAHMNLAVRAAGALCVVIGALLIEGALP